MSCSCFSAKNKTAIKTKKGTNAHKKEQRRKSAKAPANRQSSIHLQKARERRASKGISLKMMPTLGTAKQNPMTRQHSAGKRGKRGSVSITKKMDIKTANTKFNSSNNTNTNNNNNTNIEMTGTTQLSSTNQDYDQIPHDVALQIIHSSHSDIRKHLETLGAADGLESDQGSDTESEFGTDDESP
tara:strand:- start:66 stop:620 length:555 start_codon:yes stop_codon:yes gene_type:complete